MVVMLSASSAWPYIPDIPMAPSPSVETSGPVAPSLRVIWVLLFAWKDSPPYPRTSGHDRADSKPNPGQVPAGAVGGVQRRRLPQPSPGPVRRDPDNEARAGDRRGLGGRVG